MQAVIPMETKKLRKYIYNFICSLSDQEKFENTQDFHNTFSLYIPSFLYTFIIVIHQINWPFMRAEVDQKVLWWSRGQTCYQVLLKIIDKLVYAFFQLYFSAPYDIGHFSITELNIKNFYTNPEFLLDLWKYFSELFQKKLEVLKKSTCW